MKFNDKNKTELKSIDFAKENIVLKFRDGKPDGILGYSNVKNMDIVIDNSIYTYKGSEYIRIDNIHIMLTLASEKIIEINTKGDLKHIYFLVDLKRRVGAFKLTLQGAADTLDFVLRVYSKTGKKLNSYVRDKVSNLKVMAVVMLLFPILMAFTGEKDFMMYCSLLPLLIAICSSLIAVIIDLYKNALRKELGL